MNIHHLELFYYVAKHRGVSAAARHIPYGIQQPAISAQVIQLEDSLGVPLFQRRPFALTAEGQQLFSFIEPFFGKLGEVAAKMRGDRGARLRIGAPPPIQRNYLPAMLRAMKTRIPDVSFTMTTGLQDDFEQLLLAQELDVAFTAIHGKPAHGLQSQEMLRVPLALVVREKSWIKKAEDLWTQDRIEEALLAVALPEPVTSHFLQELNRRKIEWYPSVELASLDHVCQYVAEGFGVGITLAQPDAAPPVGTRLVPLPDFPEVPYVALWLGKPNPMLEMVLRVARSIADDISRAVKCR